jgi:hypothetical protein
MFDMDCQFEGGRCESNICVDTAAANLNVFPSAGELLLSVRALLSCVLETPKYDLYYFSYRNSLTTPSMKIITKNVKRLHLLSQQSAFYLKKSNSTRVG